METVNAERGATRVGAESAATAGGYGSIRTTVLAQRGLHAVGTSCAIPRDGGGVPSY